VALLETQVGMVDLQLQILDFTGDVLSMVGMVITPLISITKARRIIAIFSCFVIQPADLRTQEMMNSHTVAFP
jgi:hypothetical protein